MYGIDETESDKRRVGRPQKVYTEEERPERFWVAMPHRLWSLLPELPSERNKIISNLVELVYGDPSLGIRDIHERITYLSRRVNEFAAEATEKVDALKKEEHNIMQAKAKIEEAMEKIDALKREEQDIIQAKAKIEEAKRNGVI